MRFPYDQQAGQEYSREKRIHPSWPFTASSEWNLLALTTHITDLSYQPARSLG